MQTKLFRILFSITSFFFLLPGQSLAEEELYPGLETQFTTQLDDLGQPLQDKLLISGEEIRKTERSCERWGNCPGKFDDFKRLRRMSEFKLSPGSKQRPSPVVKLGGKGITLQMNY